MELETEATVNALISFAYDKFPRFSLASNHPFHIERRGIQILGVTVESFGCPTHFWVKYQGVHYDRECPAGVGNWRELPFFQKAITS